MKKLSILLILAVLGTIGIAQEKNGTVFSEHEYINKAKLYWSSIFEGDKETLSEILGNSVIVATNGDAKTFQKESITSRLNYWKGFENLKINNHGVALPDAIEYNEGSIWVQDWLLASGTHIKTGINLDLHIHNMYNFNKDGEIVYVATYYNNNVFEKITDNLTPSENGTIYMNHPFITSMRKLINAYTTFEIEKWSTFFTPNAIFNNTTMKPEEFDDIDTQREKMKQSFANTKKVKFVAVGYPDCLHYNKEDNYLVLSWWNVFGETKDGKKFAFPMQFSHWFTKDGKIYLETTYYSSNHFE